MKFSKWKESAQKVATSLGLPGDLWDKADSYDLIEAARCAFAKEQTPREFIEEMFADDLASMEHDNLLFNESLEYSFEEDIEG